MKKLFIIFMSILSASNICYAKDAYLEDKNDISKFYNFLEVARKDMGPLAPGQKELNFYELHQELINADTKSGGRPVLLIYDEKYDPKREEVFNRFDLKNPKEQFSDARFVRTQLFATKDRISKKINMPELGEESFFDYTEIDRDKLLFLSVADEDEKDTVLSLIKSGVNVNYRNHNGLTVLMRAASVNTSPEMIKLLVENGAKVNDVDIYGRNALIYAALTNSNNQVAKELIKLGSNTKLIDINGLGFMDYARYNTEMQEAFKNKAPQK